MSKNKRKVPRLRFSRFNDKYNFYSLIKISKFRRGSFPQPYGLKKWYDDLNGLPFVQVYDINDNMLLKHQTKRKISKLGAKKSVFVSKGSLLLTIQGSIGRLAVTQYDAYVDRTILIFEGFKLDLNIHWFKYALLLLFEIEKKKAPGGTIKTITKEKLSSFEIGVPEIKEQEKIADFFSSIDTHIQTLEKKKKALELYKKGVTQKIFKQEIRFKDDEGKYSKKWDFIKLKEVFKRSTLKNTDEKIKFVLTNSATQGIVSQNHYFDKDIANQNNLQGYYVVDVDDFIYNPRISEFAPVGPLKRNKLAKGVMSPLYTVLKPIKGNLDFFEHYFQTTLWHKYMKSVANFGARHDRMNITISDFESLPVPYPSIEEQNKIAVFLSAIGEQTQGITQQIEQIKTYKKGLLQQMFV